MGEDKYYIPEIDEFYAGFRFEYYSLVRINPNNYEWSKFIYIVDKNSTWESRIDIIVLIDHIKNNKVRVKYLDLEDILKLGFEQQIDIKGSKSNTRFLLKKEDNIIFRFQYDYETHIGILLSEDYHTKYNNIIKNINELEKILKRDINYETIKTD